MPGKPSGYLKSSYMSKESWEEGLCQRLEREFVALGQDDLLKHVRGIVVGIFKQSRQDLAKEIEEELQNLPKVKKGFCGQPSMDDLRKPVLEFEIQKLTNLPKRQASCLVRDLIAIYQLAVAFEASSSEGMIQSVVQNPAVSGVKTDSSKPLSRSEPVSRSEQEISYANAFPALAPKSSTTALSYCPMDSFWQQRMPLSSMHSGQSSQNKITGEDSSKAKALTPTKRFKCIGKENEIAFIHAESRRKAVKGRDCRGRKDCTMVNLAQRDCRGRKDCTMVNHAQRDEKENRYGTNVTKELLKLLGLNGNELGKQSSPVSCPTSVGGKAWWHREEKVSLRADTNACSSFQSEQIPLYKRGLLGSTELHDAKQKERQQSVLSPADDGLFAHSDLAKIQDDLANSLSESRLSKQWSSPLTSSYSQISSGSLPLFTSGLFTTQSNLDADVPSMVSQISPPSKFSSGSLQSAGQFSGISSPPATTEPFRAYSCAEIFPLAQPSMDLPDNPTERNLLEKEFPWHWNIWSGKTASAADWPDAHTPPLVVAGQKQWVVNHVLSPWIGDQKQSVVNHVLSPWIGDQKQSVVNHVLSPWIRDQNVSQHSPSVPQNQQLDWDATICHTQKHHHQSAPAFSAFGCQDHYSLDLIANSAVSNHYQEPRADVKPYFVFEEDQHLPVDFKKTTVNHQDQQILQESSSWPSFGHEAQHTLEIDCHCSNHGTQHIPNISHNAACKFKQNFQSDLNFLPDNNPEKADAEDMDSFGLRNLAQLVSQNPSRQNTVKPKCFLRDLSVPHTCHKCSSEIMKPRCLSSKTQPTGRSGSWNATSSRDLLAFCNCKGACNCPPECSAERTPVVNTSLHICGLSPLGCSRIQLQVPRCVMKSASDSELYLVPSKRSAFTKVRTQSSSALAGTNYIHLAHVVHSTPWSPLCRKPICLVKYASEKQLKKLQESQIMLIKPEEDDADTEGSDTPDLSFLFRPDIFGGWPVESKIKPGFLLKKSQYTQTEDCVQKFISTAQASGKDLSKRVCEEKHWKDLNPLTQEDIQKDRLHALVVGQRQAFPQMPSGIEVAALEYDQDEYDQLAESLVRDMSFQFPAAFQSPSDSPSRSQIPVHQRLYAAQLEEEWLNDSIQSQRRSSGKSKDKIWRPLHPNKPCSFYLEGCCYRSDCKFSHDICSITCQFWEEGQCFKGDLCPFLHGYFNGPDGRDADIDFIASKEDFPELSKKELHLNNGPVPKKRKNIKKGLFCRTQIPEGT